MLAGKQVSSSESEHATTQRPDSPDDTATRLRAVVAKLSRRLRASDGGGLTPSGLSVLFTICRRGPLRISELAEIEGLNPTMLSRVVADLTAAGHVRREPDPADRRAARLEATAQGRKLWRRIKRERTAALDAQLDRLGAEDRELLLRALPVLEELAAWDHVGDPQR